MKKIKLTQGKFALVDDEDFGWLNQFKWFVKFSTKKNSYATRNSSCRGGKKRYGILMHHLILKPPKGKLIDHINGNGLDNRHTNLRIADKSKNAQNAKIRSDNISGFKGVSWRKRVKRWEATIVVNGKQIYLGYFFKPIDAAKIYNIAAKQNFGEFARLNQI